MSNDPNPVADATLDDYADDVDTHEDRETIRAIAFELRRRRAEEKKAKAMFETPNFMHEVVASAATMRLLATMVPELRWDDEEVTRLFRSLSPAARKAYEWLTRAMAQQKGDEEAWKAMQRSRLGISTAALVNAIGIEDNNAAQLADAWAEYRKVTLPELRTLIGSKQRQFDAARKMEQAPSTTAPQRAPDADLMDPPMRVSVALVVGDIHHHFVSPTQVKIGSLPRCRIRLIGEAVSKLHAVVEADGDGHVSVMDLGSEWGTRVNGEKISRKELATGDVITIGRNEIRVEIGVVP